MKHIITLLILGAALVIGASAQSYSTPMRDVDEPARNAVQSYCSVFWNIPPFGAKTCTAYAVPAGKRLAIRMVTADCQVPTGDTLPFGEVHTTMGQVGQSSPIVLTTSPTANGTYHRSANPVVFLHSDAGTTVRFSGFYYTSGTGNGVCTFGVHGYLVPQN